MRPRLLKMTAFGPYTGEQIIDFERLEDANMFLIYGPTGGGKTTILDAICYALYGETNGGERSGETMRSKFADEDTITEVELYFKLRQDEYRIVRRPQYERAAKRGGSSGKLVKVASEVELYKKEEDTYKLVTAKYNEVGEKINELLHFNIGQFRQVIMIAQNKFRELLTVSSKERQQILQDIFETGIYQNVEKALEVLYADIKDQVKEKQLIYENTLSQIEAGEDVRLKDFLSTKVIYNAPEVCDILECICSEKTEEQEQLEQELKKVMAQLEESQQQLVKVNKQYEEKQEQVRLETELTGLIAKKEDYNQLEVKIEKAEKILPIIPLETIVLEVKKEYLACEETLKVQIASLKEIEDKLKLCETKLKEQENLPVEVEKLKKEYSILETYVPKVVQLAAKYEEREQKQKALSIGEDTYKKLLEKEVLLDKEIEEKELTIKQKDTLQKELAEKLVLQKEMLEILKQKAERVKEEAHATKVLSELDKQYELIKQKEQLHRLHETHYREAFKLWFNNQAGVLAETLKDNEPCPVCGSLKHPQKAALTSDHITKEALDKMEKEIKELETELGSLRETKSALEKECKLLKARLQAYDEALVGKETISEEVLNKLKEEITTLEAKLGELVQMQKALEANRLEKKTIIERKEKGATYIAEQKEGLSEVTAYITSIETEVPKELREKVALDAMLEQLKAAYTAKETAFKTLKQQQERQSTEKAQQSTRVLENQKRAVTLKEQGVKKRLEFENALEAAGFSDIGDFKIYKMTPEDLETAKADLGEYKQRRNLLTSQCKELQEKTKDFSEEERVSVTNKHQVLMEQSTALSLKVNEVKNNQMKHLKIQQVLTHLYDEVKTIVKKQSVIEKISSYAKGKNKKGLSFERYIQSSIFEEVLRSANKKLRPMTHNRYELFRSDDLSRANAQAGLDIGIKDYYNNETRPVTTLSGGESFMAALALALGLSEVIQRLAGATPLDTLFIDEGFGSLDEEALELAIKTLLSIQDTGRLIGIISHVKELREQIPVGLEITTGARGSSASFKL